MNQLLQEKINQLKASKDFECWYLVRHNPDFCNLCYLIVALKEFIHYKSTTNLEDSIKNYIEKIKNEKGLQLSDNYRSLRVAAFLGLIRMQDSKYENAIITPVFDEINNKCKGEFENTSLYQDVIDRQIEKIYTASIIDEKCDDVRKDFRIYPVMFLNKVLIEIGKTTGNYSISQTEYKYLAATTKKYQDYLDTMLLIKLLRDDPSAELMFTEFRDKFDNRMNVAISLLSYLSVDSNKVEIKKDHIQEITKKVFEFENGNFDFGNGDGYLNFLCSVKSFFDYGCNNVVNDEFDYDNCERLCTGTNVILYGVPGAGKSWTIEHCYKDVDTTMERVVFHPDYTYSDFVGQILPRSVNGNVTYDFIPGPFTKIVNEAYHNPKKKFILVIEEINRGNAPAIFGDIFQLLDRDTINCGSSYGIINADIAKVVYGDETHEVRLPSNLSIICTMNTSDQNVFTLDTAFQRRWNMRLIENTFKKDTEEDKQFAETKILDSTITWEAFCNAINEQILEKNQNMTSSEDKRLGTHFVTTEDLTFDGNKGIDAELKNRRFPEKVIKYLWDDAFKFYRDEIFKSDYNSLEKLIKAYTSQNGDDRFNIFKDNIRASIDEKNKE